MLEMSTCNPPILEKVFLIYRPGQITGQTKEPTELFEFSQFGLVRKQIWLALGGKICEFS